MSPLACVILASLLAASSAALVPAGTKQQQQHLELSHHWATEQQQDRSSKTIGDNSGNTTDSAVHQETPLRLTAAEAGRRSGASSRSVEQAGAAHRANATSLVATSLRESRIRAGERLAAAAEEVGVGSEGLRQLPAGWIFGGIVLLIIPVLVVAGCVSLSSQTGAPALVAGAVAVVFGKMTGRRPRQPSPPTRPEWSAPPCDTTGARLGFAWQRSAPGSTGGASSRGAGVAAATPRTHRSPSLVTSPAPPVTGRSEATQYRQWADPRLPQGARWHNPAPLAQDLKGGKMGYPEVKVVEGPYSSTSISTPPTAPWPAPGPNLCMTTPSPTSSDLHRGPLGVSVQPPSALKENTEINA